jgi:hypothetical protein
MDRILVDLDAKTSQVVPFTPEEEAAFLASLEPETEPAPTAQPKPA